MNKLVLTAMTLLAVQGIGYAQESTGAEMALPQACDPDEASMQGMSMQGMAGHNMAGSMDEAHQALMASMSPMQPAMEKGMQAEDLDVAFVCGMIAHHMGAIAMAKVELQYGDDEWVRTTAQNVIDAQEKEVADLTKWLEDNAD